MRKRENPLSFFFFFFFWLCEFVHCEELFYKVESPREGGISCDAFQDMDGSGALVMFYKNIYKLIFRNPETP